MDFVQAWWTDNMPGDEFPVETRFITMSYTPTTPSWTQFEYEGPVDIDFSSPISKPSMTTLDLRIVELLRVGFKV